MNDAASQPPKTPFTLTTSRARWYHFTLREILFAFVAVAAVLGWWVNLPKYQQYKTNFATTFDPLKYLRSTGVSVWAGGSIGSNGLQQYDYTLRGQSAASTAIGNLREEIRLALEKESGVALVSSGTGNSNGLPHFTFRYRTRLLEGIVFCRAFPSGDDEWRLYFVKHEMSVQR